MSRYVVSLGGNALGKNAEEQKSLLELLKMLNEETLKGLK